MPDTILGAIAEAEALTGLDESPAAERGEMELTVIVPARNEEDCLGACLQSLVTQSNEFFAPGRDWECLRERSRSNRSMGLARDHLTGSICRDGGIRARRRRRRCQCR